MVKINVYFNIYEESIIDLMTVEIIILGNKIDVRIPHRIDLEMIKGIYEELGIKCYEVSAVTGKGVKGAIMEMVESKRFGI